MTLYVYILSTYDEYGAEHVSATLNRAALIDMLRRIYGYDADATTCAKLATLLLKQDNELATPDGWSKWIDNKSVEQPPYGVRGYNLSDGWGGMMLHVIPLEA